MKDLRIYCSDEYKKKVKVIATQKGITVSDMLHQIVSKAIPDNSHSANCNNGQKHIVNDKWQKGGTANE